MDRFTVAGLSMAGVLFIFGMMYLIIEKLIPWRAKRKQRQRELANFMHYYPAYKEDVRRMRDRIYFLDQRIDFLNTEVSILSKSNGKTSVADSRRRV